MFIRVGLETNLDETKSVVFTPIFVWGQIRDVTYKRRSTGGRETFWERKRTRVSCSECDATMLDSSKRHHMDQSHGVSPTQTRGVDVGGRGATTYVGSFPRILKLVESPVPGCTEKAHISGRMRGNFMYGHFRSKVAVLQEGSEPLPQCGMCGMHILAGWMIKYKRTV